MKAVKKRKSTGAVDDQLLKKHKINTKTTKSNTNAAQRTLAAHFLPTNDRAGNAKPLPRPKSTNEGEHVGILASDIETEPNDSAGEYKTDTDNVEEAEDSEESGSEVDNGEDNGEQVDSEAAANKKNKRSLKVSKMCELDVSSIVTHSKTHSLSGNTPAEERTHVQPIFGVS